MAVWQGEQVGKKTLESWYAEEGWLREAFTYPSNYFHGVLTQIVLPNMEGTRRVRVPDIHGVPPFNRTTLENNFLPNSKKRAS